MKKEEEVFTEVDGVSYIRQWPDKFVVDDVACRKWNNSEDLLWLVAGPSVFEASWLSDRSGHSVTTGTDITVASASGQKLCVFNHRQEHHIPTSITMTEDPKPWIRKHFRMAAKRCADTFNASIDQTPLVKNHIPLGLILDEIDKAMVLLVKEYDNYFWSNETG